MLLVIDFIMTDDASSQFIWMNDVDYIAIL
ncbi:hypothetical protein FORC066_1651 [Yersinia enterocolitica]|nr:hypothetical protein FORC066_1651 [Yersinia enterocolitica]